MCKAKGPGKTLPPASTSLPVTPMVSSAIVVAYTLKKSGNIARTDVGYGGHDAGVINGERHEKDDNSCSVKVAEVESKVCGTNITTIRSDDIHALSEDCRKMVNKKKVDSPTLSYCNSVDSGRGPETRMSKDLFLDDPSSVENTTKLSSEAGTLKNRGAKGGTVGNGNNHHANKNIDTLSRSVETGPTMDDGDNVSPDKNS